VSLLPGETVVTPGETVVTPAKPTTPANPTTVTPAAGGGED
jgi:hypothetical protein